MQNTKRSLPFGKEWIAHCGKRARLRNLRQNCSTSLQSKDLETLKAIDKLKTEVKILLVETENLSALEVLFKSKELVEEFYFLLHLFHAQNIAQEISISLSLSIDLLCDSIHEKIEAERKRKLKDNKDFNNEV